MTREEAKHVMEKYTDTESGISKVVAEAHSMAIKALEQEPCDDCISREAAINCVTAASMCDPIITQKRIKMLPSVQPKVKIGHWIHSRVDMYACSECGKIHTSFEIGECDADYCPNCGAKMEVEHD